MSRLMQEILLHPDAYDEVYDPNYAEYQALREIEAERWDPRDEIDEWPEEA